MSELEKPKFKMTKQEMLDFNDDCAKAVGCRSNMPVDDRDILLKEITAKQLVKHWRSSEELFEFGYHVELSEDTKEVFQRYEIFKAEKKIWKIQHPDGDNMKK